MSSTLFRKWKSFRFNARQMHKDTFCDMFFSHTTTESLCCSSPTLYRGRDLVNMIIALQLLVNSSQPLPCGLVKSSLIVILSTASHFSSQKLQLNVPITSKLAKRSLVDLWYVDFYIFLPNSR